LPLLRHLFLLWSLVLLPAVAGAQTFPALAPLPGTGTLGTPADPNNFTFVMSGDNRPAKSGDPQPSTLTTIVKAIQGMKPAFALWAGDTISGKKPTKEKKMKKEYEEFLGIVQGAGIPVFAAPGNHELNDKPKGQSCPKAIDVPDPSGNLLKFWEASMGVPFGVFRYGNSAFVSLNTDDTVAPGVKIPPCKYNGYVGPGQLAALSATLTGLAADKDVAHIFVFMHCLLYASPVNPGGQLASASRDPLILKVLDGCPLGGHYWVYAGGLTDVEVAITVTDTLTGATRNYHNPPSTAFAPIRDTSAFNCGP